MSDGSVTLEMILNDFGAMAAPALSTFGPMAGPIVAPFEAVANKMMEAAKMMVQGSKHRAMNVEANQQPQ